MQQTRERVLDALAKGPVSGPALAAELGVSRTAVWNHVEALREADFEVESGGDGYRLAGLPEFGGPAVEYGLEAPFEIEYHDAIPSTNARARELAADGAEDLVVLADQQTGGRGRLDREWVSPSGGVWLSILFRPDVPTAHAPVFTLAAAVATTRAARAVDQRETADGASGNQEPASREAERSEASNGASGEEQPASHAVDQRETPAGIDARIKWPNDVIVPDGDRERKLAGVLTEMDGEADRVSWVIVGIGVNANVAPADLPSAANPTSLREQVGDVDRRAFTQRLLEEFQALRSNPESILPAWREDAATLGRRVRVETPTGVVEGEALEVRFPGTLVVDTRHGEVELTAGDCDHLRPAE